MSTYFVTGNLRHDGRRYVAGEAVELSDEQARTLAHVVQTEPVATREVVADVEEPTPEPEIVVGGERLDSGEPSVDGTSAVPRAEAEDVTPVIDAPEAPKEPAAASKSETKRGQSSRSTKDKAQQAGLADMTQPVDPSADL